MPIHHQFDELDHHESDRVDYLDEHDFIEPAAHDLDNTNLVDEHGNVFDLIDDQFAPAYHPGDDDVVFVQAGSPPEVRSPLGTIDLGAFDPWSDYEPGF